MTRWFRAGLLGAVVLATPATLSAQARQGFSPAWERTGLDFRRDGVWRTRARAVSQTRANLLAQGDMTALNAPLRAGGPLPTTAAITGVLRVPVILFGFQNSAVPQPFAVANYTEALFATTPPAGRPYTLRSFYEQMSNGLFSIQGDVSNWVKLKDPEATYTGNPGTCPAGQNGNCNGINNGTWALLQVGLAEAIDSVDAAIDFAQYDNDGPDGVPNSGDDDGFVDIVTFMHSELDGACGGATNNHPWSHRFSLQTLKTTNDARSGGGFIQVSDYLIQSAVGGVSACAVGELVAPGTAAHELGHGLGIPDLYDTQGPTEGIGQWGLMGSGNYTTAFSPARMEAWSLNQMGWVTLRSITTGGTYTLGPAPTSDTAFVILPVGANPRGQSWLIENRQAVQADTAVIRVHCARSGNPAGCGGGLLIWHVDNTKLGQGAASNTVNSNGATRTGIQGLSLVQADNLNNLRLATTNRGDAGDVWPGTTNKVAFGPTTQPAALLNNTAQANGVSAGFGIDQIAINGGVASLRIGFATPVNITTGAALTAGVMGAPYSLQLAATGGLLDTYDWTVVAGTLPQGVTLAANGLLSGTPQASGDHTFTVRASSGGQTSELAATLAITQPALVSGEVVKLAVTGASSLTAADVTYLDLLGNKNGGFDIGDFLAWVRATGATGSLREFEAATRTRKEK